MVKFMFFGFRKDGLTREQALARWSNEQHASLANKLPGIHRWVRNHPISEAPETAPDRVGELWFDDQATLDAALNSNEMAEAFKDAERLTDLDKTFGLVVAEQVGFE